MTKGTVIPPPGAWDRHPGLRSPGPRRQVLSAFLSGHGSCCFFHSQLENNSCRDVGKHTLGYWATFAWPETHQRDQESQRKPFILARTLPECLLHSRCWLGAGARARLTKKHTVPAHMALGPIVEEASLDLSSTGVGVEVGVRSMPKLRFPDSEKQCFFSYLSGRRLGRGNCGEGLGSWQDKGPQPKHLSQPGLLGTYRQPWLASPAEACLVSCSA